MRLYHLCLLCFSLLTFSVQAQNIDTPAKVAQVMAVLDKYVGHWVGTYELTDLTGQVLQELDAEVDYSWVPSDSGPMLKGQAVYGAGGQIGIASSQTYIQGKTLISIVEEGGRKRTYRGALTKEGNGISWTSLDKPSALDEAFTEVFGRDFSGQYTLTTKGYESIQRDGVEVLLTLRSVLFKTPAKD